VAGCLVGALNAASPTLRFCDATLGYNRRPAVHHLSGTIEAGSLLAVVGPNGAGKSTLLKGLAGALKPLAGSIGLDGLRREDIAYLPQAADLDRSFPLSIFDLVSAGGWRRQGLFGGFGRNDRLAVSNALSAVGLGGFENRVIGSLSGGQLQRALFARLLLQDARLILLDEPFTAIDSKTTADLLDLIGRWHGEKRTVIAVLHDMDVVKEHFPQTLLLAREAIAWGPTADTLRADNLLRARRMIESHDPHAAACGRAA
jgi:zinc/manganese transport system ATP-binding protein